MTTITIPPDLEQRLTDEASRRGTTPELLALEGLRRLFPSAVVEPPTGAGETLFDFLAGHIGVIDGPALAYSENCGALFTESLIEKQKQGKL
jgi:hypothetical protein